MHRKTYRAARTALARCLPANLCCLTDEYKDACHGCIIHVLAFLENLGGTFYAQAASNAHCLRDSIEISVSDLLLTYQSLVSVARADPIASE